MIQQRWLALAFLLAPVPVWAQASFQTLRGNGAVGGGGIAATVSLCLTGATSDVGANVAVICGTHGTNASGGDGAAVTATATAAGQIGPVIDTQGFRSVAYDLTLPAGSSVQFQESASSTSPAWHVVTAYADPASAMVIAASSATLGTYRVPAGARYQRIVAITYAGGSMTAIAQPRLSEIPAPGTISEPQIDLAIRTNDLANASTAPRLQTHEDDLANAASGAVPLYQYLRPISGTPVGGNVVITTSAITAIPAAQSRMRLNLQVQGTGFACASWVTAAPTITVSSMNVATCGGAGAFRLQDGSVLPATQAALPNTALTVIGAAPSAGTLALNLVWDAQ